MYFLSPNVNYKEFIRYAQSNSKSLLEKSTRNGYKSTKYQAKYNLMAQKEVHFSLKGLRER